MEACRYEDVLDDRNNGSSSTGRVSPQVGLRESTLVQLRPWRAIDHCQGSANRLRNVLQQGV